MPDDRTDAVLTFLGHAAETFCESLAGGGTDVLLYVEATADGVDVGVKDLDGLPPADALLGAVAPDEWSAMGVAAKGWASPIDARPGRRSSASARRRAQVVVFVHRSGEVVGRLRVGDTVTAEAPESGLTVDSLQRALGLPTTPPLWSTSEYFALIWLQNVIDGHHPMGWPEACALHPAFRLLADDDQPLDPADLVAAARALARVVDWERLRWLAVEASWPVANLTPTEAAWCDAGAFSRWVMDRQPPVEAVLADLRAIAGPSTARRCAGILNRLGVPFRGRRAA